MTSRATRAVSPTRKQMFHEVEDEQDQHMLHMIPSLRWAMEGRKLASSTSHTSLPPSLPSSLLPLPHRGRDLLTKSALSWDLQIQVLLQKKRNNKKQRPLKNIAKKSKMIEKKKKRKKDNEEKNDRKKKEKSRVRKKKKKEKSKNNKTKKIRVLPANFSIFFISLLSFICHLLSLFLSFVVICLTFCLSFFSDIFGHFVIFVIVLSFFDFMTKLTKMTKKMSEKCTKMPQHGEK